MNFYFQLYNGTQSRYVSKLCGSWKKRVYTSNQNIMTVNFHSDDSISGLGFIMRWKEIEGKDGKC